MEDEPLPLIVQTSGGTTGLPRPMIFSPRDREVMNIMTGRRLFMQGVRPFDLVQVCLSLGLTNGGLLAREGIWKYTGAVPVMTGSGRKRRRAARSNCSGHGSASFWSVFRRT